MSQAHISAPEVVREVGRAVHRFGTVVEASLGNAASALQRTREQLRLETLPQWKRQLVRRQEDWHQARMRFLAAESEVRQASISGGVGRGSSDDERRDLNKAKSRLEQAEERIATITRWLARLDHDGDSLAAQCANHALAIHDLVQTMALRCERAGAALDTYHGAGLPPGSVDHG